MNDSQFSQLKSWQLYNNVIGILKDLGGSASIAELREALAIKLALSDQQINAPKSAKNPASRFYWILAWTLTELKALGFVDNSQRGVWALSTVGIQADQLINPQAMRQQAVTKLNQRSRAKAPGEDKPNKSDQNDLEDEQLDFNSIEQLLGDNKANCRARLIGAMNNISPYAFESLCKRVLRESGFVKVGVTSGSHDQGVDGHGLFLINDLVSFKVIFQCKRYRPGLTVSSKEVRDFRGAMSGRADKGLFITTSNFSTAARTEAERDGVIKIDLLDGEALADKMWDLELGVSKETHQIGSFNDSWFDQYRLNQ